MKEQTNTYESLLCPITLFRFFIRKQYKGINISNEDCDGLRIEFAKYLYKLELTDKQKENILPPNTMEVIMNADHPYKMNGFPPAYVYHFTEFVEKMKKELEK